MDRHLMLFTTDKRQERLGKLFAGEKEYLTLERVNELNFFQNIRGVTMDEWIYVLPIPVSKLDANSTIKEQIKQELLRRQKDEPGKVKVFGGVFHQEWISFLEMNHIPYWDFMKLPEVVDGNAYITAEATVAEVLKIAECSICGQHVAVTGYGCCGEKIAKLFANMGANVTVVARREEVRDYATRDGFEAIGFGDMPKCMENCRVVINTVPSLVLTEECIRKMSRDSLIIDIASKPGGTDFDAAKKYGITAKLALGLPGIYTTTSSALLLKNAILKHAPLQENVREGKLWIYQIII